MQYIQLSGQLAPEMDTPLEGSYNLFIDSADGTIKLIDDEGNWYGSGTSLISTTYAALKSLYDSGSLQAGSYYLISDFKNCYDQPDYNLSGTAITTGNYKVDEDTSPIIVFATAENKLAANAFQPQYPKDSIKYDITFNQTEVTNSPARGRITERIDEWGNRTDYDHRAILFRRYDNYYYEEINKHPGTIQLVENTGEVIGIGTSFTEYSAGNYIAIPGVNQTFFEVVSVASDTSMVVTGRSIPAVSAGASLYPAQIRGLTYKQNNISIEYTEHPTFKFIDETIIGNYIGDVAVFRDWNEFYFLLPNNVFGEDVIGNRIGNEFMNNTFESDVEHNVIGDGFQNNTIYNDEDFTDNIIGNNFRNNLIICDDFNDNVIGDNCYENQIFGSNDFFDNHIGVGFNSNIIYRDFEDNKIGNGFDNNVINGEFNNNSIGNQFYNNNILTEFIENSIGYYFYDNNIASYFNNNQIGNNFENNTIGDEEDPGNHTFENNQFGNEHKGNLFLDYFSYNILENNSYANEFSGSTSGNRFGDYVTFNTIGTGFNYNQIGRGFYSNDIGDEFYNNQIGNGFEDNNIEDHFNNNQIGNDFEDNEIGDYFAYNVIGHRFQSNNIADDFGFGGGDERGNRIGNNFYNNTIGEYFYDNNICDNFTNNTVGNYFQFNRIETGLNGTDFTTELGRLFSVSYATGITGTDGVYTNIAPISTSGIGTGARFTITVSGGVITDIGITTTGKMYQLGDTITIFPSSFGGASDLILDVDDISATPMVYGNYNKTIQKNFDGTVILVAMGNGGLYWSQYITEPID